MNMQWILYHPIRLTSSTTTTTTTTTTVKNLIVTSNVAELDDTINDTETFTESIPVHHNILPSLNADGKERMTFSGINFHHNFDLSPLLPFGMMLIICTIIFILIIFRRWPGLVAGIIAGCLTSISIYLLFLAIKDQKLVYE